MEEPFSNKKILKLKYLSQFQHTKIRNLVVTSEFLKLCRRIGPLAILVACMLYIHLLVMATVYLLHFSLSHIWTPWHTLSPSNVLYFNINVFLYLHIGTYIRLSRLYYNCKPMVSCQLLCRFQFEYLNTRNHFIQPGMFFILHHSAVGWFNRLCLHFHVWIFVR